MQDGGILFGEYRWALAEDFADRCVCILGVQERLLCAASWSGSTIAASGSSAAVLDRDPRRSVRACTKCSRLGITRSRVSVYTHTHKAPRCEEPPRGRFMVWGHTVAASCFAPCVVQLTCGNDLGTFHAHMHTCSYPRGRVKEQRTLLSVLEVLLSDGRHQVLDLLHLSCSRLRPWLSRSGPSSARSGRAWASPRWSPTLLRGAGAREAK